MGTVGNEGFVGIPAAVHLPATEYAVVQIPGEAYALDAQTFQRALEKNEDMRHAVIRYIGYAHQVAQQATACNSYHSVEQRLARWLLTVQDRARKDEFPMTHELLSHMVAATRPRVGEAAARLRSAGTIGYHRGMIRIADRTRLEAKACECYAATRRPTPFRR